MTESLSGKVAVVTGANRGIGAAIVEEFLASGATVVGCARTEGAFDAALEANERFYPAYFDMTDADAMRQAVLAIRRQFKTVDVLVNNAGRMSNQRLGFIAQDEAEEVLRVNVVGPLLLTQYLVRLMQPGASIINLASIVAQRGNAGQITYSASKGAVISMTLSLAKELGPQGIRVNAVAPGLVETDAMQAVDPEKLQARLDGICLGRPGQPADVARCCAFLASDQSSYISGEVIGVNGCSIL